jgi:hypothetical protein
VSQKARAARDGRVGKPRSHILPQRGESPEKRVGRHSVRRSQEAAADDGCHALVLRVHQLMLEVHRGAPGREVESHLQKREGRVLQRHRSLWQDPHHGDCAVCLQGPCFGGEVATLAKRADLGIARVAQCIDAVSHVVLSSGSMAEMEDRLRIARHRQSPANHPASEQFLRESVVGCVIGPMSCPGELPGGNL